MHSDEQTTAYTPPRIECEQPLQGVHVHVVEDENFRDLMELIVDRMTWPEGYIGVTTTLYASARETAQKWAAMPPDDLIHVISMDLRLTSSPSVDHSVELIKGIYRGDYPALLDARIFIYTSEDAKIARDQLKA